MPICKFCNQNTNQESKLCPGCGKPGWFEKEEEDKPAEISQKSIKVEGWAKTYGYEFKSKPKFYRSRVNATGDQPPTKAEKLRPLQLDISDKTPIAVKRALKGGAGKKTCLLDIGDKTYVVKGGSGNVADHMAASDFIRKLDVKGVKAPACRALNDEEKSIVANAMPKNNADAQQLATSLTIKEKDGSTSGLVSELADGRPLDKLIPQADDVKYQNAATDARNHVKDMDQTAAWKYVCDELSKSVKDRQKKLKLEEYQLADNPKARKDALGWFKGSNLVQPVQEKLIEVLAEIDRGDVKEALEKSKEEAESLEADKNVLVSFAKSAEGIEAFAGVAVIDLISGMDDRILSKPNGGNFVFDANKKELCCIDNSKAPAMALTATDLGPWMEFVSGNLTVTSTASLEDMIFKKLYEADEDAPEWVPSKYVTFDEKQKAQAKVKIREVLDSVIAKVASDKDFGGPASERAAFLKARLELEDLFKIDAKIATPPVLPTKIGTGDKVGREAKGLFSETRKETQQIKDDLRKGKLTAEEAKTRLTALQQTHQSLATDRRSAKLDFLISATMFRKALEEKAKKLVELIKSAPAGLWSAEVAKNVRVPLRSAFDAWTTSAKKDEKTLNLLSKAWATFPDEVKAA